MERRAAEPDIDDLETPIASPFRDGGRVVGGGFFVFTLLLGLHLWRVWPAPVLPPLELAVAAEGDPAPTYCLGATP